MKKLFSSCMVFNSSKGDQRIAISRKMHGLLLLGLLLLPARSPAQAGVNPNVTSPTAGALVGDNLTVVVNATSTYEIESVTATVADRTTNLLYSLNTGWTGTLLMTNLSRGTQTLIVNAVDVFGNSGQSQVSFVHDTPPVLTVLEPSTSSYDINASAFTRPAMRVRASATDDNPVGAVIQLVIPYGAYWSAILATATNSMDTVVDLSGWDGSLMALTFIATDSAGQTTKVPKGAYVIANTNVIELDRVSGNILDVSERNILFTPAPGVLTSKSRLTGAETNLVNNPDFYFSAGTAALTPRGAIFIPRIQNNGVVSGGTEIYEIRDGSLVDLGGYGGGLVVKGNYAIWIGGPLTLRDLLAGTNVVVSSNAPTSVDLAPNGDVVFMTSGTEYGVYYVSRYRNGITTQLGSGIWPRTDGVNVGYFAGTYSAYTNMALFDGTNTIILGPSESTDTLALNNGWTGFMLQRNGAYQVWTRSPAGVLSQRTFFGTSSYLEALGPSGDLVAYRGTGISYVTSAGSSLDLGNWNFGPWPFWKEGYWYAALGESLLTFVVPSSISISQPGWTTNGEFSFYVSASIGQQVIVQESTNLVSWVSISTNTVSGTPGLQATISGSRGSDKRFYRLISVQ